MKLRWVALIHAWVPQENDIEIAKMVVLTSKK
jgi:hypothetical protein